MHYILEKYIEIAEITAYNSDGDHHGSTGCWAEMHDG